MTRKTDQQLAREKELLLRSAIEAGLEQVRRREFSDRSVAQIMEEVLATSKS